MFNSFAKNVTTMQHFQRMTRHPQFDHMGTTRYCYSTYVTHLDIHFEIQA